MSPGGLEEWTQLDQCGEDWRHLGEAGSGPSRRVPGSDVPVFMLLHQRARQQAGWVPGYCPLSIHPTGLSEVVGLQPCPKQDCLWLPLGHIGTQGHDSRARGSCLSGAALALVSSGS